MNAALTAIAESEADPRFMPPVPSAFHDHGAGRCEEVPLVSRAFLLQCGTIALCIVLGNLVPNEQCDATTKEGLVDFILSKTRGSKPAPVLVARISA